MIVCDVTYAYNEFSGGIRTYIDAKRAHIRDHTDWSHVLIVPGRADDVTREGRLTKVTISSPILLGSAPYRIFTRRAKLAAALRGAGPDVIEFGSLDLSPWAAFRHRREYGVPVFGFYHTDLPEAYVGGPVRRRLGDRAGDWLHRQSARYVHAVYRRCDVTMTASSVLQDVLVRQGLPRVELVPFGVDLELFQPQKSDAGVRPEIGVEADALMLVYAGRFDREKRVRMLCDAVMRLPSTLNAVLVLVGQGPMDNELRRTAAASDRLRVLPYEQDKEQLARLLASSDVYLAGNPHETFGLAIVEAQASGLPVVGVRAGAIIERVPDHVGELCDPDDAGSMAAAIQKLVARDDWKELRASARRHVEENLSWRNAFERQFTLYEEYARSKARSDRSAVAQGAG